MRKTGFVFVLITALAIPAQTAQPVDEVKLTPKVLGQYGKATANLVKAKSAVKREIEQQKQERGDGSTEAVIAALTRGCEQAPSFQGAVTAAELTCRDYALLNLALMQASILALGVEKRGDEFFDSIEGGASKTLRENVRFVLAHKAEVENLGRQQRTLFQ